MPWRSPGHAHVAGANVTHAEGRVAEAVVRDAAVAGDALLLHGACVSTFQAEIELPFPGSLEASRFLRSQGLAEVPFVGGSRRRIVSIKNCPLIGFDR